MNASLRNTAIIARREFLWRGRSRSYLISTIILVVVAIGVALAPVVVRWFAERSEAEKIAVYVGDTVLKTDPLKVIDLSMNGSIGSGGSGGSATDSTSKPTYAISLVSDLTAARREVVDGKLSAVLALVRGASGDLTFDLYTKASAFERTPALLHQGATSIAIQDRLDRLGISASDQVSIFAPATFAIRAADPAVPGGPDAPANVTEFVGDYVVGFALTIFIFMAIMLYGQWVAMSVAEEKNSRVMELVLGAATPVQLLAGKVLGVGGLALLQYVIVFVPATLAILFQDRIAALVLGGNASTNLPTGLTIDVMAVFGILFVLGFALYAVLYAGAASMVSRQEDVNQVVAPLTLLSTAGYMIAAYAGSGLIDLASPLMRIVSFFPLVSPYLILSRMSLHKISAVEVVFAIVLLILTIGVALWFAARIYTVGVLMYGQKPGLRAMFRAFRTART